MKTWAILLVGVVTVAAFVAYTAVLLTASWPLEDLSIYKAALFGDSFGVLNSFFTGGAFLLILWTIVLQQAELSLQRKEMSRMVSAHRRELHMNMVNYAIADRDLAAVWGESDLDAKEAKQEAYILIIMTGWRTDFSQGIVNRSFIERRLRQQMKNSEPFRRFWQRWRQDWHATPLDEPKYAEFLKLCDEAFESGAPDLRNEKSHKGA